MVNLLQSGYVHVPARLRSDVFGRGSNGIKIESDQPIAVEALDIAEGSCSGMLVFPLVGLGRYYHVVNWYAPSIQAEFGVVTAEDDTMVEITFPRNNGVIVPFEGRNYTDLEVISITLNAFETIQLRDIGRNDLTGTRIVASKPVAVFSGNFDTGKLRHQNRSFLRSLVTQKNSNYYFLDVFYR